MRRAWLMIWKTYSTLRDLGRLRDIAAILVKYGFGDLVRRIGLGDALERAGDALHWDRAGEFAHMPPPARVRCALEELGPTFVKFGQLLSSRADLLDPDWIAELAKLRNRAPPAPWDEVQRQLCEDLGGPPETVFAVFDPVPIAAASIAQVHRGRLHDGTEVAIKVRRPGIRPIVDADLRWLVRLAQWAENDQPEWRALRPREIVRQFAQSLARELDLVAESRNAERFAENFAAYVDDDALEAPDELLASTGVIVIPAVHWDWTSERIAVQDLVAGIPGDDLQAVDAAGLDRRVLARRGARAVLKMIVEDGFFHADPHAGNVFYLAGNRIAFIDFGMVGALTEERRYELVTLLLGLVDRDPPRVVDIIVAWTGGSALDEDALTLEIQQFVDRYRGVALKQLQLGTMLSDLVAILRTHRLALPSDLAMLVKALVSLEGMGRELDPDFDMATEAEPMLQRVLQAHFAPAAIARRGWRAATDAFTLLSNLPRELSRLLRAARRGTLEVKVDVTHLRRVGNQIDRAANRLAVGIVVAALVIGSSIVMTVPGGPSLLGLPVFGLLGFVGAVVGGLWLVLSIWRSARRDRD